MSVCPAVYQLRSASDSSLDSDTDAGDRLVAALAESRQRLELAQAELRRRADQHDPIYVSTETRSTRVSADTRTRNEGIMSD